MTSRLANIQQIYVRQCRFLERRYPALLDLHLPVTAENASAVFDLYCWHVKRLDPVASAQDRARFCRETLQKPLDPGLRRALLEDLVSVQIARGLPGRALPFLEAGDPLRARIETCAVEHARHYGVDLRAFDMTGSDRGCALRFYLSEHAAALKGRKVLHIAPEAKCRPWMQEAAKQVGFSYSTADGFVEDVDHAVDLCALPFAPGQFDYIIVHRVLEHVIDDATALAEFARVLPTGGILNISVPEQLYMAETADWRVPDPDVHQHFRVYGRDFPRMLETAGFEPGRCDWLLQQSVTRLKLFGAYPLLFYTAVKR